MPNIEPSEEVNDFRMEKQLKKMHAKISLQQREETILQETVFQLQKSIAEKRHTHLKNQQLQTHITDKLNHEKDHHGALIRVASAVSPYGKFFRGMNQQHLPSAIMKIIELGNNHIIKKVTLAQIPDEKQEEHKHEINEDVTFIPMINTYLFDMETLKSLNENSSALLTSLKNASLYKSYKKKFRTELVKHIELFNV